MALLGEPRAAAVSERRWSSSLAAGASAGECGVCAAPPLLQEWEILALLGEPRAAAPPLRLLQEWEILALLGTPTERETAATSSERWRRTGGEGERVSGVDDGVVLEEEEFWCARSDRAFASVLDNQVDAWR